MKQTEEIVDTSVEVRQALEKKIADIWNRKSSSHSEETELHLHRVEVPCTHWKPLPWLSQQTIFPRIYWSDRQRTLEVAAVGSLYSHSGKTFSDFQKVTRPLHALLAKASGKVRVYGGVRFDPGVPCDDLWQPFAAFQFVLPRFELIQNNRKTHLAYHFFRTPDQTASQAKEEFRRHWEALRWNTSPREFHVLSPLREEDFPLQKVWEEAVLQALELMKHSELEKVVLARKKIFYFPAPLEPFYFMNRLRENTHNSFLFLLQFSEKGAFLGGTPEQLFRKSNTIIESDALASTRPRGKTLDEDLQLEQELLTSTKELTEHRWVSHMIENTLKKLCQHLDMPVRETVLKLQNVQHIHTRFRGELKKGVGVAKLLAELHPTPAVAGLPRGVAMEVISRLEGFDRGWYAGPVGWMSRDSAEFAVAIRSALVRGNSLTLFAGAGIVEGSIPAQEWMETESKLLNFTRLLQQND